MLPIYLACQYVCFSHVYLMGVRLKAKMPPPNGKIVKMVIDHYYHLLIFSLKTGTLVIYPNYHLRYLASKTEMEKKVQLLFLLFYC